MSNSLNAVEKDPPPHNRTATPKLKFARNDYVKNNSITLLITYEEEPRNFLDDVDNELNCTKRCTVEVQTTQGHFKLNSWLWETFTPQIDLAKLLEDTLQLRVKSVNSSKTKRLIELEGGSLILPSFGGIGSIKEEFTFGVIPIPQTSKLNQTSNHPL